MPKQKLKLFYIIVGGFLILCLAGSFLVGERPKAETIQEVMRDAVLHEGGKISFFGILEVNPAVISGMIVTGVLLLLAAIIRIFVIPRFRIVPGKLQLLLEAWVSFFSDMAKTNSPHHHSFLGAYIFAAGSYIFFGTVFELFGLQWVTVAGHSITLPAPLSDINGAISIGCLSYLVILLGGIVVNKFYGALNGLKEFSLPISLSFRRPAQRTAGDGTGLLQHPSQLSSAGGSGSPLHAAARLDPDLCPHHADQHLLWRGYGTPRENRKTKEKGKTGFCLIGKGRYYENAL